MGVFRTVPEALCTEPMKPRVLPRVRETVGVGIRLILPADPGPGGFALPPQPGRSPKHSAITATARTPERNLPMHSSSHVPARYAQPRAREPYELENL